MVIRPVHLNAYEFVVVAAHRAKQLLAGCTPRLEGDHSVATMAQMEVAAGRVVRAADGTTAVALDPLSAAGVGQAVPAQE
jgi:DNA-directed RNA polymerase subunit K/omega